MADADEHSDERRGGRAWTKCLCWRSEHECNHHDTFSASEGVIKFVARFAQIGYEIDGILTSSKARGCTGDCASKEPRYRPRLDASSTGFSAADTRPRCASMIAHRGDTDRM